MFDNNQPERPQSPRRGFTLTRPLIVMACGAGGLLLSLGLCGASAAIHPRAYGIPNLALLALLVCALSVLSIFVGFLWLIIAMLFNALRS